MQGRGRAVVLPVSYTSWPQQVAYEPMGESDKPWGAKEYFTIGRELVMLSKPAANLIMDLGRRVQSRRTV